MDPLATYSERLLEVRREFFLYPDRVVVKAHWLLKGNFEHTVRLENLRSNYRRFTVRYRVFRYAGWVLALGALFFAMAYYRAPHQPLGVGGTVTLAVAVLGAIMLAVSYPMRRIEFVRFDAKSGRGGLDIGSAGKDSATFEGFVRTVEHQIARRPR